MVGWLIEMDGSVDGWLVDDEALCSKDKDGRPMTEPDDKREAGLWCFFFSSGCKLLFATSWGTHTHIRTYTFAGLGSWTGFIMALLWLPWFYYWMMGFDGLQLELGTSILGKCTLGKTHV